MIDGVIDMAPERVPHHQCGRTAADMHDGIIQTIFSVSLTLDACQLILRDRPGEVESHLGEAIAALNQALDDIRTVCAGS